MTTGKRQRFWIDAPLQLQMLGYVLVLVASSLLLVEFSLLRGLQQASDQSRQIFHSLDWVRDTMRGPLILSSSLSILAAGVITLIWSHRFAGPLLVLSAATERLRRGDFTTLARVRETDTHQDLIREFAQMQESLREMIKSEKDQVEKLRYRLVGVYDSLPPEHPLKEELHGIVKDLKLIGSKYQL